MKLSKGMSAEHLAKIRGLQKEGYTQKNPMEKHLANPKSLRLAVNARCWDCSAEQKLEVKLCPCTNCPLYSVRPYQKKNSNDPDEEILNEEINPDDEEEFDGTDQVGEE